MKRVLALAGLFAMLAHAVAAPPLILISLDGFRWDYLKAHADESRFLRGLAEEGVIADGLIPVFPSNTFPNHYSVVTGLYPTRHGIVNNDFFDADSGRFFRFNQPALVGDPRWWHGEPLWVTAIQQGRKAATAFWVGSEAPIRNVRPTHWRVFDYRIPFERRLEELAGWFRAPEADRPAFVAFYLEEANAAGHAHGPDSPQVAAAVKLLDDRLAAIFACLHREGIQPNVIIVSDHGMTAVDRKRVVVLEDYLTAAEAQVDFDGSVAGLRPLSGDVHALLRRAARIPHAAAYRVEDLPARLRIEDGPRTPPVWVLADEGAHVVTRATFERLSRRYSEYGYLPGDHGYDPALRSMHGILVAHGPAFRRGIRVPALENVHVYNLMCATLGLQPAANQGDGRLLSSVLRK